MREPLFLFLTGARGSSFLLDMNKKDSLLVSKAKKHFRKRPTKAQ